MCVNLTCVVSCHVFFYVFGFNFSVISALRAYQEAMEAIEIAGSDAEAMEKAMDQFERASSTMDRVGGWDAETFALQVSATCRTLLLAVRKQPRHK